MGASRVITEVVGMLIQNHKDRKVKRKSKPRIPPPIMPILKSQMLQMSMKNQKVAKADRAMVEQGQADKDVLGKKLTQDNRLLDFIQILWRQDLAVRRQETLN